VHTTSLGKKTRKCNPYLNGLDASKRFKENSLRESGTKSNHNFLEKNSLSGKISEWGELWTIF